MVDRERLDGFRIRFGLTEDPKAFTRFKTRIVHAATGSLRTLRGPDRIQVEKEFAFRNGSEVIFGDDWNINPVIQSGIIDQLDDSKTFTDLVERIQHLLWTFEEFGFFEEKSRYGEHEYSGLFFVKELHRAIELSPGVNLRVQAPPGRAELLPAGLELLDEAVDAVSHWLIRYPDVEKEYRQTLTILAEKKADRYRHAQDSLRFGLEKLLKILLGNNTRLEDQGKPLKNWLEERGVSEALRDVAVQIMLLLAKQYQNAVVKHDNNVGDGEARIWSDAEVEYVVYQYTALMRLLLEAGASDVP